MNKLTCVITSANDSLECVQTVKSIRDTAGDRVSVCCVDDCSSTPLRAYIDTPGVKIIENRFRCGVGPSRHIGALGADTEFIILLDSHCRFTEGWYEALISRIEARPKTVHCCTCLGLQTNRMDVNNPVTSYNGATLNVCGPDRNAKGKTQIMESVWLPPGVEDNAEIPAVMGACYAMSRDWFLTLGALKNLRLWGLDETLLSVKSWLAGGDVRFVKGCRIGHRFTLPNERPPYDVAPGVVVANKLFAIHTLTPKPLAEKLQAKLKATTEIREWTAGFEITRSNWHNIAVEIACNQRLFVRSFDWLVSRFGLNVNV